MYFFIGGMLAYPQTLVHCRAYVGVIGLPSGVDPNLLTLSETAFLCLSQDNKLVGF